MSFRVIKDVRVDTIRADQSTILPIIEGPTLPFNLINGTGGGLLYNKSTRFVYYNNGSQWLPLSGGGGGGNSQTYSMIKNGALNIPTSTPTILTNWSLAPIPYHDDTGSWNPGTGVFNAAIPETLGIDACITWAANFSTYGKRTLEIIYKPSAGVPVVAKSAITQPDPNVAIETTQEACIVLKLNAGDQAWVQVTQDSGVTIPVVAGTGTSLCGSRVTL
jgi:hypothetical protein